jgi:predicted nuclease of restriction endonuclease-like (RecB) superfamily
VEPRGYAEWFEALRERVLAARFRAARAANTEIVRLYWSTGRDILARQREDGWGAKVVDRIAADMKRVFPGQRGWSRTNLMYMRKVAVVWPTEEEFVPRPVGQIPWGHVRLLVDRLDTREERDWYAAEAAAEGWSLPVLSYQISSGLHRRVGAAPSNFPDRLTPEDSDMAQGMTKDPYVFDTLGLSRPFVERDLEAALMSRLQHTLMEIGRGMALVGRQVPFTVGGRDYVVDLLFFHTEQLRYVVVELKVEMFQPAHLGQLGAYVAMVDDLLRRPRIHAPTVGILLCQGKDPVVRYSLASTAAPVAVADWTSLPADARAALPTAEELRAAVDQELAERRAAELNGDPDTQQ